MFGKSKVNPQREIAIAEIKRSLDELEVIGDWFYTVGLIDMARYLEVISTNEAANFKEIAHEKRKAIKNK